MLGRALGVIAVWLSAWPAFAQTLYTSDELLVLLRTGPSLENSIIRNMRPGTALEVIEADAGDGYARVRVAGTDVQGYVLTQYLTRERAARDLLIDAERDLAAARAQVAELEARLGAAETDLTAAQSDAESRAATHAEVSAELADIRAASAAAVELRDAKEDLERRVAELVMRIDLLTAENADLARRDRQNWFIVGALVLVGGVVIGLIAPSLRPRRRSSW